MKIIELRSENVKKVKAIEIIPKDDVVIISGKNGAGKTSVLDSIWYALEGKTGLKGTPMPIRKGESRAEVRLVLDDFIVTRNWTSNDKSYLKVTNKEGMTFSSPQELLDSFIGKLTFDPLEFAHMREIDQRNLLLMVADIDIDYWDSALVELREKRRLTGQEVKLLSGEREDIDPDMLPKKSVSTSELNKELEKANENNYDMERAKNLHKSISEDISNLKEEIRIKQKSLSDIEITMKGKKIIPTDILKEKIEGAEEANEIFRANERNIIADKKQAEAQKVYDDFTGKIEGVIKEKETTLSTAKMPIKGLKINDIGVAYNDIPFSQLSSSEQLRVSMAIAMALNPKLKVIRITDGSLLDEDSMKIIRSLANKRDYQVWLERVDSSGKIGFYIEEGEVKNEG